MTTHTTVEMGNAVAQTTTDKCSEIINAAIRDYDKRPTGFPHSLFHGETGRLRRNDLDNLSKSIYTLETKVNYLFDICHGNKSSMLVKNIMNQIKSLPETDPVKQEWKKCVDRQKLADDQNSMAPSEFAIGL